MKNFIECVVLLLLSKLLLFGELCCQQLFCKLLLLLLLQQLLLQEGSFTLLVEEVCLLDAKKSWKKGGELRIGGKWVDVNPRSLCLSDLLQNIRRLNHCLCHLGLRAELRCSDHLCRALHQGRCDRLSSEGDWDHR